MKEFKGVSEEEKNKYSESYAADPVCRAMTAALYKTAVNDLAFRPQGRQGMQFAFSVDVPAMKVTNQKASGRCWIFAGCNILRELVGPAE